MDMEEREKLRENRENGACVSKNLVSNPVIEAALLIIQASLEAVGKNEVLPQLINKLSNGLGKVLENTEEKIPVEESHEVREEGCKSSKTLFRSSSHKSLNKVRVQEETDVEEQGDDANEKIFSFLKEATACGALMLKDADSAFQCFQEVVLGKRKGRKNIKRAFSATVEKETFGEVQKPSSAGGSKIMKQKSKEISQVLESLEQSNRKGDSTLENIEFALSCMLGAGVNKANDKGTGDGLMEKSGIGMIGFEAK